MTTTLTATVQATYARVLLQLTFTAATSATISRVHADGSVWPLRDANPVAVTSTTGVGAVVFDHEAPLDQTIFYTATSGATSFNSNTITVASDPGWVGSNIWLTHPVRPALSMLLAVTGFGAQGYDGRNGILQILGSNLPVSISDARVTSDGTMTATTTTIADTRALRALLADGATLLMRPPGSWSEPWQYITVGKATETPAAGVGPNQDRDWSIPYNVVAAPAGQSQGAVGSTWADDLTAYATWTALLAGESTWSANVTKAGP